MTQSALCRGLGMIALALLLCLTAHTAIGDTSSGGYLKPDQAFSHQQKATDDGRIEIHWHIAPGYYLYRSRIKVEGKPSPIKGVDKPKGKRIDDPYFGQQQIYKHDTRVIITPGDAEKLELTWQGCAEAGLCYPPQHATIDIADISGAGAQSKPVHSGSQNTNSPDFARTTDIGQHPLPDTQRQTTTPAADATQSEEQALAARLADSSTLWTLLAFFGLGLLLTFTPCVLPMVPILSSLIVGAGARGMRGFVLSLAFVLPMALTYAVLGVAAALAGANLQAMLQTPLVIGLFAAVFIILAAAMFGLFELQLPAFVRDRLNQASANRQGGHIGGAAALGVISAVLVGPCMTAPLAGALLYIADTGNALLGGTALLLLGLGMGVPLLVVGTVGARLMPRPGPWMNAVKTVFGFILLATALWLVGRIIPAPVMLGLWGVFLILVAVALGFSVANIRRATTRIGPVVAATLAIICGLWGALMIVGASGGATDPIRPLAFLHEQPRSHTDDRFVTVHNLATLDKQVAAAGRNNQWTIVDFYADWCISCKIIDKTVFGDPKVQKALADTILLRPDVTDDNTDSRRLMQQLGVLGPPTILFIAPSGQEQRGARIVGEIDATQFLQHWQQARQAADS